MRVNLNQFHLEHYQTKKSELLFKNTIPAQKLFVRKLTFERLLLRRPNLNVIMCVRIKGMFSRDNLIDAIKKVQQKRFLLKTRIFIDEKKNAWFTSENVSDPIIEEFVRRSDDDWIQKAIEEHKYLFLPEKGPLIRFILLKSLECSDLLINCHHMICDGFSLVYLVNDILNYLDTQDMGSHLELYPYPVESNSFKQSISLGIFPKFIANIINKLWIRKNISLNENNYIQLHEQFWKIEDLHNIFAWKFNKSQTNYLIHKCNTEKISVNSAIIAAFLLAQKEIEGNNLDYLNNVFIAVNFRDKLKKSIKGTFGLYASSVIVRLKTNNKKNFWEFARNCHANIHKRLSDKIIRKLLLASCFEPTLFDSIYFSKYGLLHDNLSKRFLKIARMDKINVGFSITNLGKIDLNSKLRSFTIEALYGPIVSFIDFQEKVLSVLTINDEMYFTLSFGEKCIKSSEIERIKRIAMNYLLNLL